jgi:hypothetical protein
MRSRAKYSQTALRRGAPRIEKLPLYSQAGRKRQVMSDASRVKIAARAKKCRICLKGRDAKGNPEKI